MLQIPDTNAVQIQAMNRSQSVTQTAGYRDLAHYLPDDQRLEPVQRYQHWNQQIHDIQEQVGVRQYRDRSLRSR